MSSTDGKEMLNWLLLMARCNMNTSAETEVGVILFICLITR